MESLFGQGRKKKIAAVCVQKVEEDEEEEEEEGKKYMNRARAWLNFWVTPKSEREALGKDPMFHGAQSHFSHMLETDQHNVGN